MFITPSSIQNRFIKRNYLSFFKLNIYPQYPTQRASVFYFPPSLFFVLCIYFLRINFLVEVEYKFPAKLQISDRKFIPTIWYFSEVIFKFSL